MNGNGDQAQSLEGLQAALTARATMQGWAEGMELIELVDAVHRAGWLAKLHGRISAGELAAATGVPVERTANVLAVLTSAGVVRSEEGSYRLSPAFDAIVTGASGVDLPSVLDALALTRKQIGRAVQPSEHGRGLGGEDALVLARHWGVQPTTGARQLYSMVYEVLPDYRERLEQGGPLLDVGCGVGGALLTSLSLFDKLRAVGVDVVPEIAAETRRRAREAGVADRVEVRALDARTLADKSSFAVCFWAQEFFSVDARAATLAAIFTALRPDGLLLMQELVPPATGRDEVTVRRRLDDLFYRQHNVVSGFSAEALAAEADAAGFRDAHIVDSPVGRLVLARKPGL